jgi:hypothetical protein
MVDRIQEDEDRLFLLHFSIPSDISVLHKNPSLLFIASEMLARIKEKVLKLEKLVLVHKKRYDL